MARSSLLLCAIMLGATTIAVDTTASATTATGTCTNLNNNSGTETSKYASRKADDYGACCTICAVDVNCGHFVWEPNTKNGCHLKKLFCFKTRFWFCRHAVEESGQLKGIKESYRDLVC